MKKSDNLFILATTTTTTKCPLRSFEILVKWISLCYQDIIPAFLNSFSIFGFSILFSNLIGNILFRERILVRKSIENV